MRFRLVPKSMTLDDLELLYVQIFSEFCATWHTVLSDTQKAQCYMTVRDNQCFDPSPTPVTKSTCCCATEGRGWGHPCSPCPSPTDPLYLELCPHGPGLTNGGAGKTLCSLCINFRAYFHYGCALRCMASDSQR